MRNVDPDSEENQRMTRETEAEVQRLQKAETLKQAWAMLDDVDHYHLPLEEDESDLQSLFNQANQDTDAASIWFLHSGPPDRDKADGAVIIVKGAEATLKAYNLLCNHGLLTPGKPVTEAA